MERDGRFVQLEEVEEEDGYHRQELEAEDRPVEVDSVDRTGLHACGVVVIQETILFVYSCGGYKL